MKTSWTTGVDPQRAIDITQNYKESVVMRARFTELVEAKMDASWRSSMSKAEYANPNWAYLQADARGYERALKEIISLLSGTKS